MRSGFRLNAQYPTVEDRRHRLEERLEHVRRAQTVGFHPTVAPRLCLPARFQMLPPLPFLADMAAELMACVWSRASCCSPYRILRRWQYMQGRSMPSATAGVHEE